MPQGKGTYGSKRGRPPKKKEKGYFVGFTEDGRRWGSIMPTWSAAMKEEKRYKSLNKKRVSTTENFSLKNLRTIVEDGVNSFFQKLK